jgi:multiple sugar transport system permease protein
MYLYRVATNDGNYFYAAALSVALALVTFVFSFSVLRLIRRQAGV